MENKIFVRIKSGDFVEALDPSRARRAVLHLTTIEDYQTAAEIPLFLDRGGERVPLKVLSVEGLSPLSSEECRLDLETRLVGRRGAEFRVVQNGRLVLTETCGLPIPGPGRRFLSAAAILAGAAALALLALLAIRGRTAGDGFVESRARAPGAGTPPAVAVTPPNPPASAPVSDGRPEPPAPAPAPSGAVPLAEAAPPAPASADPLAAARDAFRALGDETLTIYFPADSSEILPDQTEKLRKLGAVLARYPELDLTISGHCATAGTEKGRMALSEERARAVYEVLAAGGWKPIQRPAMKGFGDRRPATRDEDRQALNRRVEIRLVP